MKRIFLMILTVTMTIWSGYAANSAQSPDTTGPSVQTRVQTISPCCGITNIDHRSGLVTAQQLPSRQAFQFIAPAGLLPNLKVGQKVWMDPGTQVVSVEGAANCCRVAQADSGGAPTGSVGQAAKSGTKSRGGLDSIKPGDSPPVTASPEPSTAGAIRGRPATPSSGTQDRAAK